MSAVDLPRDLITLDSFQVEKLYNLQDVIGGNEKYEEFELIYLQSCKKTPSEERLSLGVVLA